MSEQLVPFFFLQGTGESFPLWHDEGGRNSFSVLQMPLGPRYERPAIRLFVPNGTQGFRFLTHRKNDTPETLFLLYPCDYRSQEERAEDFSAYSGGKLYQLKQENQTLLLYQYESSTNQATLTIMELAEKQVFLYRYLLTVDRSGISGLPEHIRERYQETLGELFNPSHKKRKEEQFRGEDASRAATGDGSSVTEEVGDIEADVEAAVQAAKQQVAALFKCGSDHP